jgi:hypothetical protein
VTCLSASGNRAWIGGPITASSDPSQVGMGAWWQVADNGAGRHPVIPDRTTFVGIGTRAGPAGSIRTSRGLAWAVLHAANFHMRT